MYTQLSPLPVLEVQQFIVDLVDVDIGPEDVVVAVHSVDHVVVEAIELLGQVQLLADVEELGVLRDSETKELLTSGVCGVLSVQSVEAILVDDQAVRCFPWGHTLYHGARLKEDQQ